MENAEESMQEKNNEETVSSPGETVLYPPKFEKQEETSNIWLRSFISLALYLALGYYIFKKWEVLLLITAIIMIHELGHFFAMKFFRYRDLGIFFIPLLGAYVSGSKREVSQRESAIILLAGPLPGIMIGIGFYFLDQFYPGQSVTGLSFYTISILFILLNLINLLPVYPLDGGQLLNRVFLDEESVWSKLFIFLSMALLCWFASRMPFYPLLIFPAMMLFRLAGEKKITTIEKRIEAEGINTDLEYADLPDSDYWKIRNILIEEQPAFRDIPPSPPYAYDVKEEKIMTAIQHLLHRHLIQDISIAGKILLFLVWAAALASPWLIKMEMSFFHRFGL
jgi:Zn-dependent protease